MRDQDKVLKYFYLSTFASWINFNSPTLSWKNNPLSKIMHFFPCLKCTVQSF